MFYLFMAEIDCTKPLDGEAWNRCVGPFQTKEEALRLAKTNQNVPVGTIIKIEHVCFTRSIITEF